jgi:VWFA-related protein
MRRNASAFRVAVLAASLTALAAGQQTAIEAVVTKDGVPVRSLRPEDVSLWIDGKPHPVTAVLSPLENETRRTALVFDSSTLSAADQSMIRQQVTSFLQLGAQPRRLFAVIKWFTGMEVIQPFTTDPGLLKSSIENLGASGVTGVGSKGEITSGYSVESGRASGGALTGSSLNSTGSLVRTQYLLESFSGLCEKLAPIPGRKAVWFITGGGYQTSTGQDLERIFNKTGDACNRANVVVHVISNDAPFSHMLSSSTGGTAVRFTGALERALERLATEDAVICQLQLQQPSLKSGCYDVRVKVPKGLNVRWKKRYCTL